MFDSQLAASALITLGLIPLVWSALFTVARTSAQSRQALPDDREEKRALAFMLAPLGIGVGLLIAGQFAPPSAALPLPLMDRLPMSFAIDAGGQAPATSQLAIDWPALILPALAAIYLVGAAIASLRLMLASLRLHRTLANARPTETEPDVAIADTDLPPFATGGGRVILPAGFVASAPQPHLDLIIAHERTHITRGDARYYLALAWIDAVLWFNPFVHAQTARCRLAAELACDDEVVGHAPEMRRTYAQAIVSALKHAAGNALPCAPAAFSTRKHGEYRMRIASIMQGRSAPRKQRTALTIAALIAAAPMACVQFAYAFDAPDEAPAFTSALVDGKLSSTYGDRKDPFTEQVRFHSGVDIAAPDGTAIRAPADGTVTRYQLAHEGYGNFLEVDHGDGYVTRYGQLKTATVSVGDKVTAGQKIAEVGSSGRATGPHLHIEVYKDGETIDPATVLVLPDRKG